MQAADSAIVASPKRTRRRFSREYKARLVALATSGEHSISQVTIDHQLNVNMLRSPVPIYRPVRVAVHPHITTIVLVPLSASQMA